MNHIEELKETIEKERQKLDELAENGLLGAVYEQSLVLDQLIEEYLDSCGS